MTIRAVSPKDPDSVEPFSFDFGPRLAEITDDAIDELIEVVIDDADGDESETLLVIGGSPAPAFSGSIVTAWLSEGTLGKTYTVRARITTTAGRTLDLSMRVTIAND